MDHAQKDVELLLAEDDDEDCLLIERALKEARFGGRFKRVGDGEELLDRLTAEESDGAASPRLIILLDLNMPRMDGRQALRTIKSRSKWRKIPVIILTTSQSEREADQCYEMGANSFITKPTSYHELVDAMSLLRKYWMDLVALPMMR